MKQYRRALAYFREDRRRIVALLALIAASTVLGLLQAWPMAVLVDSVLSPAPRTDWVHRLFLAPLPHHRLGQIIGVALMGMLLKVLQDVIWMGRVMLNHRLRYNGSARMRCDLFHKLQELHVGYHKAQPQGDAIYRLSADALGCFGILDTFIATSVAAITLTGMTLIMLSRNIPLTIFALSITPFLVATNLWFGKRIRQRAAESKQLDTDFTTTVQRSMSSIALMQAFGRQMRERVRFRRAVQASNDGGWRLNWQEALYPLAVQVLFALGGAVVFGYGGYLVYRDQFVHPVSNGVTCGDLMVFMAYLGSLWDPLCRLCGFSAAIQGHAAACARVYAILDRPVDVEDHPDARALPVQPRTLRLSSVHFGYQPEQPVLRGVSARVEPGQMVAFVGPSGTGKSTLLNLLPRFYDPHLGTLQLDGHDLRHVRLADVRRHIALVSQDSPLLPATIAENIAYGKPEATREEIAAAAEAAGAAEFIDELPDRYDTLIAENGGNLSGGQRQRLAIARALLTDAPILVLDEPTSALDSHHAHLVLDALQRLRGQRTVVLVTHHLASVRHCDRIFVMHDGTIVEHGTHDQLLRLRGVYHRLLDGVMPPVSLSPSLGTSIRR